MAKRQTPKIDLEGILNCFDRELQKQVDVETAAQIRALVAHASADLIVSTPAKRLAIVERSVRALLAETNANLKLVHLGTIEIGRARVLRDFANHKEPEVIAMLEVLAREPSSYSAADADVLAVASARVK